MDRDDILGRAAPAPDEVLRYGDGAEQVADFWYPAGGAGAAAALIVFLHGGFWRAAYDRVHARPLAVALAEAGYAVVLPEYRRTGQAGGGWPGTFDDVALAVDVLPGLVPAVVSGVVGLAAVSDLTGCARQRLGRGAAQALMGGGPRRYPERYAVADPARLLPVPVPVRLVHGADDDVVPSEMSVGFAREAAAAGGGDAVRCDVLRGCGHFELIDPLSAAWPAVLGAFRAMAAPAAPTPDA
jgi:alpha/beta superfamily hydrolase